MTWSGPSFVHENDSLRIVFFYNCVTSRLVDLHGIDDLNANYTMQARTWHAKKLYV
jgi:hypothetical protein